MESLFEDASLSSPPSPRPTHNKGYKDNSGCFNDSIEVDRFDGDDGLSSLMDPGIGRTDKFLGNSDHDERAWTDEFGYLWIDRNEIPLWRRYDRILAVFASQRHPDPSQGRSIDRGSHCLGVGGGALAIANAGPPTGVVQEVPAVERLGQDGLPFFFNNARADESQSGNLWAASKNTSEFLSSESRAPTAVSCVKPALICPSREHSVQYSPFSDDESAVICDGFDASDIEAAAGDAGNISSTEASDVITEVRRVTPALSETVSNRPSHDSVSPTTPKTAREVAYHLKAGSTNHSIVQKTSTDNESKSVEKKPEGKSGMLLTAEFMLLRFGFRPVRSGNDTWSCPFLPATLGEDREDECNGVFDEEGIRKHVNGHCNKSRGVLLECPMLGRDGCNWSVTEEKVTKAMTKLRKNPKAKVNSELTRHVMDKHLKSRPQLCPCGSEVPRPLKDQLYRHLRTVKHTKDLDNKRQADRGIADYPDVDDPRLVEEQEGMGMRTEPEPSTKRERKRKNRGGSDKEEGSSKGTKRRRPF